MIIVYKRCWLNIQRATRSLCRINPPEARKSGMKGATRLKNRQKNNNNDQHQQNSARFSSTSPRRHSCASRTVPRPPHPRHRHHHPVGCHWSPPPPPPHLLRPREIMFGFFVFKRSGSLLVKPFLLPPSAFTYRFLTEEVGIYKRKK